MPRAVIAALIRRRRAAALAPANETGAQPVKAVRPPRSRKKKTA